jgi:type II secretory pathway pseudopilin PulG
VSRVLGFTLVEVAVAGSLLSIGILSLLAVQAQALELQRRVRTVRELVSLAEGELDRRLATLTRGPSSCAPAGAIKMPLVGSCLSTAVSCAPEAAYPCGGIGAERAVVVTVRVTGSGGQVFELEAAGANFPGGG